MLISINLIVFNDIFASKTKPKNVQRLNLSSKGITKLGNSNLFDYYLQDLKELYLDHNKINEIDQNAFNKTNILVILDLSSNYIIELKTNVFSSLMGLLRLNISNNRILNIRNETFNGQQNLQELFLDHNNINKIELKAFNRLDNLYVLDLSWNNITELKVGIFISLTSLQNLNLSNNRLLNIPNGIFNDLKKLQHLDLTHNQINEINIKGFYYKTKVNDPFTLVPKEVEQFLPDLEDIRISHNQFNCSHLTNLIRTIGVRRLENDIKEHPIKTQELNVAGIRCIPSLQLHTFT